MLKPSSATKVSILELPGDGAVVIPRRPNLPPGYSLVADPTVVSNEHHAISFLNPNSILYPGTRKSENTHETWLYKSQLFLGSTSELE